MKKIIIIIITIVIVILVIVNIAGYLGGGGMQQEKVFQVGNIKFFLPKTYKNDLEIVESNMQNQPSGPSEFGFFLKEMKCLNSQDDELFGVWYGGENITDLEKRVKQTNIKIDQNVCKEFGMPYMGMLDTPIQIDEKICGTRFVLLETGDNYLIWNGGKIGATDYMSIKTHSNLVVTIDFRVSPSNDCKQKILKNISKLNK